MTGNPFGERTPAQHALLHAGWADLDEPARSEIWWVAGLSGHIGETCSPDWDSIRRAARTLATRERNMNKGKHWVAKEPDFNHPFENGGWQPVAPRRCEYDPCGVFFEATGTAQRYCSGRHRKAHNRLKREWCE